MDKNYQIVIVSTKKPEADYFTYDEFYKSLEGEEIINLGDWGMKGLSDRPRLLYRAIKEGRVNKKYTIFCDSWDLVFVDSPEIIIQKHLDFGNDVTISAERNSFPEDLKNEFDNLGTPTTYKYLNCGVIVGETEMILKYLGDMDAENIQQDYWDVDHTVHINEQLEYQKSFLRQPIKIGLDYMQDICWCMQDVDMDEVLLSFKLNEESQPIGTEVRNKETKTFPSIIHWNGGSKSGNTMQPILKHLKLR
ncbi:MAG: glycosyltransferase domain-containing protein [Bacteroidota bacterium]